MIENPLQLSRQIYDLSEEYFKASLEMGEIASRSGTAWLELRKKCKTDKECDRMWETTADGIRENYLKFYLKGCEKKISSLKLELRIITGQGA